MDMRAEPRAAKRALLSPDFVRAMLAGHSALGLAFAALIYIVCASGTVSVFVHEWQRWEQPDGPLVAEPLKPEAIQAALAGAHAKASAEGAAADIFMFGPGALGPRFSVHYDDHDKDIEGEWLADSQGRLVTPIAAPWSHFLVELHMALHLPRSWGLFLVGLTGVALLSSLISGVLSHPRIFRDAFALRWGGSRRLQEADLHNRLGVWGLPFHVIVTLSGALLGLSTLIIGLLAMAAYDGDSEKAFAAILGPLPGQDRTLAPLPDLAAMIRQVQERAPAAQFVSVNVPHAATAGQVVHLGMKTPGHLAMSNSYFFDGAGKSLGDGGLETGSIGQQILGLLQPLHFGWFAGIAVKLAYGLFGLALTIVSFNGVTIWLARRRDKGRPAPILEVVWSALGWSQPLAFATTALAALLTKGAAPLIAIYLLTMAAALACGLILRDGRRTAQVLRFAVAVALLSLVALHAAIWGGRASDPMALYLNAALVLGAVAFVLPSVIRNRRLL